MLGSTLRSTWAQPYLACRYFSFTNLRRGHYETLGIPKSASKVAIKASFYKLSKKYHPDVNSDDSAKEKFQAVNEAYSVLGDDRRRRAYDREIEVGTSSGSSSWPSQAHHPYYDPSSSYEFRRRGASYAWENARRARSRTAHHPPPFTQYPSGSRRSGASENDQTKTRDPFSSQHVRRATGHRTPFEAREDRLKKEPVTVKFAQVLGLVFFIVALSGGFR